jgi:outer membrane receptor protein involved in Fe transport
METSRNRLAEAIRLGLFAGIFAGVGAGFASPVLAQDEGEDQTDEQAQEQEEEAADLGRVAVTGSRIERAGLDTFYPAITVDRQLIEDRAYTNVADALNEIPTFGNPDATPQGVQNGFSVGQNFVDFLGLGAQRTLTLVNGRRFVSANVPSVFGESGGLQVDFNVIPIALVDRIETIGIGGAPIYGSDAIAGTINVILRDRFEGLETTVRHGFTSKGDAEFENVMVVAGANTADGKGNVTFSAEWYRQGGLLGTERPRFSQGENDVFFQSVGDSRFEMFRDLRINIFSLGGLVSNPATGFGDLVDPAGQLGFGPLGIFPDGNFYQFDGSSNLVPFQGGESYPGSAFFAIGGDGPDFFDNVEQLQSPLDRGVFTGQFNYDLTPNVRFSSEFLFSQSDSEQLTTQGGFQTFAFGDTSGALQFSADHPFLPQQAQDLLAANGIDTFFLHRFNNDIIDSSDYRDQQLFRWTGGFEGDFFIGNKRFNWEAYAVHGEADIETESEGIIDGRFLNAIDVRQLTEDDLAAVDPTDLQSIGGQGSVGVGDLVCESVYQAALDPNFGTISGSGVTTTRLFIDGCVPLNLFGQGARSEAAREWVTGDRLTNTKIEQTVYNFNIGGDLIDLPAGALGLNVGYEGRRETAFWTPGLGTELPVTRSAPFAETGGEFDTDEFFAEAVAPIFSEDMDIPGFHALEINGAVREIDNSQSGKSTVWSAGGNWKPVRTLNIRGNYTESIRAPSLVELFAPRTTSFSFADDPCDARFSNQGPDPEQRQANCRADGIDPATFQSNIVNATQTGVTGGNPDLTDETAEAWSVGFTWEPRWIDNLIIGADHFDIEIEDAITVLGLTDLMVACYDSANFPNNPACAAFERGPEGQVVDFTTGQTNAESFRREVQDFFVDYRFELADVFGSFNEGMADSNMGFVRLNTRISRNRRSQQSVVGEDIVRSSRSFNAPKYQGTFDVTWSRNDTRVFWRTIWQNRARLSPTQQNAYFNEDGEQVTSTSHRFISNLTVSQALPRWFDWMPQDTRAQVTVNNVFRRMPNKVEQAAGHYGFAELLGRQYTLTLQVRY